MPSRSIRIAALVGAGLVAGGLVPWPTGTQLASHTQNAAHPVGFAAAAFVPVLVAERTRAAFAAAATGFGLLFLGIGTASLPVAGATALGIGLAPHVPVFIASAARPAWPVIEDFSGPFALERAWISTGSEGTIVSLDVGGKEAPDRTAARTPSKALRFGDGP